MTDNIDINVPSPSDEPQRRHKKQFITENFEDLTLVNNDAKENVPELNSVVNESPLDDNVSVEFSDVKEHYVSYLFYAINLSDIKRVGVQGQDGKPHSSFLSFNFKLEDPSKNTTSILIDKAKNDFGFDIVEKDIKNICEIPLDDNKIYHLKFIYVDKISQSPHHKPVSWLTHIEALETFDWRILSILVKRAISRNMTFISTNNEAF
jgi:hypothetical protein